MNQPGSKKANRYIQPSLLMALKDKPSYGYEIIQGISQYGFIEGQAPPGMIYRHLRDMEKNGLVYSEWNTDETGPARRIYRITAEGLEVLEFWIGYMENKAQKLLNFVQMYHNRDLNKK